MLIYRTVLFMQFVGKYRQNYRNSNILPNGFVYPWALATIYA